MSAGQLILKAITLFNSDVVNIFDGTGGTAGHATVETVPDVAPYITGLTLTDANALVPDTQVIFVPTCTPAHPFYVRWINCDGGFEYYMFDQRKVFEGSAGGAVEFTPEIEDTFATSRTREVLDMTECKETATVGVEQLDRDAFDMLKGLIYSPRIDRWNPATEQWEGLTHDSTATAAWDTKTSLGSVEFTFRLNEIQLQF